MQQNCITYYRVSTQRQSDSGLGLDAQRYATENYLKTIGGVIQEEFIEVESGKRSNRPQLLSALRACKETGATLLIAKLDRLARNVHFISGLLESGVRFVAVDMPTADRFTLHIYAAMAEEEGRRISERTRAALAAAKAMVDTKSSRCTTRCPDVLLRPSKVNGRPYLRNCSWYLPLNTAAP